MTRSLPLSVLTSIPQSRSAPLSSEPPLPPVDIGSHKILVGLGQIDDALDDADHVHEARQSKAAQYGNEQHGQTFFLITKNELVNSQPTDDDAQDPGQNLFVRPHAFPVLHRWPAVQRRGRLNRLVAGLEFRSGIGMVSWRGNLWER